MMCARSKPRMKRKRFTQVISVGSDQCSRKRVARLVRWAGETECAQNYVLAAHPPFRLRHEQQRTEEPYPPIFTPGPSEITNIRILHLLGMPAL